ncbi:hypothetical protein CDAR_396951 [Caerostris darwini]|uniref:Uncharacterized protein n=1 Tax=Caerostris darwini TaxID=1538125 RepID=A0AAV4Q8M5_9ARAC|nr:hypothetical protein CDAR_396951 [Caerostris darwini]
MEGSYSPLQRRFLCSWDPVERTLAVAGCPPAERGWTERNWTLENVEIANQLTKNTLAFQESHMLTLLSTFLSPVAQGKTIP